MEIMLLLTFTHMSRRPLTKVSCKIVYEQDNLGNILLRGHIRQLPNIL